MVRVKASHILVKTEAEAKEIIRKLSSGDDFAKLAKLYSQCPSGRAGGDLGY
ncbi:MAG TPA: peptidylprolyl isomerase, partial [Methanocorpusculum sp.]|nr:peptidylprolyl isomerase [Methanocorpusculum sp.]